MKIYHNPRCRKSREALQLLIDRGIEPEVVEYMKEVPTHEELSDLLMRLNMKPEELLRKNEAVYKKKFKGMNFNDEEWIQVMIENPKLIERPIVVKGVKAIVARPPEEVLGLV